MREPAWDAVVVGGGPAGSATALRLARRGHRVLLVDRDEFPRQKPCGECLSPAAVRALAGLGVLPQVEREAHARLTGWRIHPAQGAPVEGAFPAGARGLAIARWRLDGVLLDAAREAGVEVRGGYRAADVLRAGGAVVGVRVGRDGRQEELRARLLVGADGLRSVVVRRLGLIRRLPRLRKLALTAHVRGLGDRAERGELHVRPWGCVGVAEVGGGVSNVTIVVAGRAVERVAGARSLFFDSVLPTLPGGGEGRRVGEVLATGPFDWPVRAAVAEGALLVGDAAGYYDPFTGQGIYRALHGAELAADAADAALRADDLSARALAPYERARRRAFAPGERLQHLIEGVVSRPRLFDHAARRMRRHPELAHTLVGVTGDLLPVRSLLHPVLRAALVP